MKVVTFAGDDGEPRCGALLGDDRVLDLSGAHAVLGGDAPPTLFTSTIALFGGGPQGLDAARRLLELAGEQADNEQLAQSLAPLDSVRLLAPVPRPPRLRDYFTSDAHAGGVGFELPPAFEQMPICYKGNPLATIGPDEDIVWPPYTDQLDFELEPAFIVGAGGRNIAVADADRHVAGVTLFNDISARDIQFPEMTLMCGPSKSKDFCNVIGPCVTTLDEIEEFDLVLEARVNGEAWSKGTTADRRYSIGDVLAWASYGEDVYPGEVIGLGTIARGCGLELDRWIQPGDVIELEMSGVGILRNRVGQKEVPDERSGLASFHGAPRFSMAALKTFLEA